MMSRRLTDLGLEVFTSQDGREALDWLVENRCDLIISDLNMPGLGGLELCSVVRSNLALRDIPILLLTGSSDDLAATGLDLGAADFLHKGISDEELAARVTRTLNEADERHRMRSRLAKYTPSEEVSDAAGRPLSQRQEVSVLFSDIRGFTAMAEEIDPDHLVRMLNRVLGEMAEAVLMAEGLVDKFTGDGVMGLFGAPTRREDDAERAVRAAIDLIRRVSAIDLTTATGGREVEIGVSVHTGIAVLGEIGSDRRAEYTAVGDTVNVAARLCGAARGGQILLGPRTRELVDGIFPMRPLEPVRLRGRRQPVEVFEVVPEAGK